MTQIGLIGEPTVSSWPLRRTTSYAYDRRRVSDPPLSLHFSFSDREPYSPAAIAVGHQDW